MVLWGDGSGEDPDLREVQCGEIGPALLWLGHLVFCRSSHSLESSLQAQLYGRLCAELLPLSPSLPLPEPKQLSLTQAGATGCQVGGVN